MERIERLTSNIYLGYQEVALVFHSVTPEDGVRNRLASAVKYKLSYYDILLSYRLEI